AFGPRLPAFIPDASVLGVQLVEQDFCFSGYTAPVPLFKPPGPHPDTRWLSDPQIYSTISYDAASPADFPWEGSVTVQCDGTLNALSFLTNNLLAFVLQEHRAVQWPMNQLILPLSNPIAVRTNDTVAVRFAYRAGCPLEALQESLVIERQAQWLPLRRAA
ncbi:MAG: hypothetical protein SH850_25990, partial [Planctomycetaceae bacterium]|nr:hypothetical protein [Planctomycetaceae bacterium]